MSSRPTRKRSAITDITDIAGSNKKNVKYSTVDVPPVSPYQGFVRSKNVKRKQQCDSFVNKLSQRLTGRSAQFGPNGVAIQVGKGEYQENLFYQCVTFNLGGYAGGNTAELQDHAEGFDEDLLACSPGVIASLRRHLEYKQSTASRLAYEEEHSDHEHSDDEEEKPDEVDNLNVEKKVELMTKEEFAESDVYLETMADLQSDPANFIQNMSVAMTDEDTMVRLVVFYVLCSIEFSLSLSCLRRHSQHVQSGNL
jgi:hypothetical protein